MLGFSSIQVIDFRNEFDEFNNIEAQMLHSNHHMLSISLKSHFWDINVFVIIQLVHSFEGDIRICQAEKSDVHRGNAEVNITFEG